MTVHRGILTAIARARAKSEALRRGIDPSAIMAPEVEQGTTQYTATDMRAAISLKQGLRPNSTGPRDAAPEPRQGGRRIKLLLKTRARLDGLHCQSLHHPPHARNSR
ncbi:hypothetical protein [Halochromatium sp.]